MAYGHTPITPATRATLGFVAGFLATLVFHQFALALLWGLGVAPFAPFSFAATPPLGVPAVLSLAFWGGVWGVAFAWIEGGFTPRLNYWSAAFLFGALAPSLVALLVVLPLKGKPPGGGWQAPLLATVLLVNGAWGLGTGLILRKLTDRWAGPQDRSGAIR